MGDELDLRTESVGRVKVSQYNIKKAVLVAFFVVLACHLSSLEK
jgi:hypothetical protein